MEYFCELVRAIGIYTGLDNTEIRQEIEKEQISMGNGFGPIDAARQYGMRIGVPMSHYSAICENGRRLTDAEIKLLEAPAVRI